jgi:hypothetical protein
MSPLFVIPLLVMSQMLDATSTLLVTHVLAFPVDVEGNPLMRYLLAEPISFLLVKLFGALLASLLILFAQKKRPKAAKGVLFLTVSLGIVAAVLNSYSIVSLYTGL